MQKLIPVFGHATSVGLARELNEDYYGIDVLPLENGEQASIFIIADGMGGHAAGEKASQSAVNAILGAFRQKSFIDHEEEWLKSTIEKANQIVYREGLEDVQDKTVSVGEEFNLEAISARPGQHRGTTLSVLLLVSNRGFIGHVGDTRIYLIRNREITQLTQDQSLNGRLLQAVGYRKSVSPAIQTFEVKAGDYFTLITDGVSRGVEDKQLLKVIEGVNPNSSATEIINLANAAGGKDNSTTIVIKIPSDISKMVSPPTPRGKKSRAVLGLIAIASTMSLSLLLVFVLIPMLNPPPVQGGNEQTLVVPPAPVNDFPDTLEGGIKLYTQRVKELIDIADKIKRECTSKNLASESKELEEKMGKLEKNRDVMKKLSLKPTYSYADWPDYYYASNAIDSIGSSLNDLYQRVLAAPTRSPVAGQQLVAPPVQPVKGNKVTTPVKEEEKQTKSTDGESIKMPATEGKTESEETTAPTGDKGSETGNKELPPPPGVE